MASSNSTVVVSVLGLSRLDGESFSSHQGVGKSSLCYRFMYQGHDDYIEDLDHRSLLALHEFENDVYRDNFLYWGSKTKTYNTKVSSQKVHFVVLEHTVFYQDITEEPFKTKTCVWTVEGYIKAAMSRDIQESRGKVSYKNSELLCQTQEYKSVLFPFNSVGKHPRGFVLVIDVSDSGPRFDLRLGATERMITQLKKRKSKFVVAATKSDEVCSTSLEKVNELAREGKFHLIECSAKSNVNVNETFELIAAKVLGKSASGLLTHVQLYHDSERKTLNKTNKARRQFSKYLQKRVVQSGVQLKAIECTEEYKACRLMHGKFETDKMFAEHLLLVRNKEFSSYVSVKNTAVNLRKKFLQDYVAERTDLSLYWNDFTDHIIKICKKHGDNTALPSPLLPCTPLTSEPLYCFCKDPAPQVRMDLPADQNHHQEATCGRNDEHNSDDAHLQDDSDDQHDYTPIIDSGVVYGRSWEESDEYMYIHVPRRPSSEMECCNDSSEDEQTCDEIASHSPELATGGAAKMAVPPQQYRQPLQLTSPPVKPSNPPRCVLIHPDGAQADVGASKSIKQCGDQYINFTDNQVHERSANMGDEYVYMTGSSKTIVKNIDENSEVEDIYIEMACCSSETATDAIATNTMATKLPQVWQPGQPRQPLQNTSLPSAEPSNTPGEASYLPNLSFNWVGEGR